MILLFVWIKQVKAHTWLNKLVGLRPGPRIDVGQISWIRKTKSRLGLTIFVLLSTRWALRVTRLNKTLNSIATWSPLSPSCPYSCDSFGNPSFGSAYWIGFPVSALLFCALLPTDDCFILQCGLLLYCVAVLLLLPCVCYMVGRDWFLTTSKHKGLTLKSQLDHNYWG